MTTETKTARGGSQDTKFCGVHLMPKSAFTKNVRNSDGLEFQCKACAKARRAKR